MTEVFRPAWVEVDLGAIRANVAALSALVAPAGVCAVVKADAYAHGATAVARAALEGGASWLAVALVEEGVALREAGIDAPILLLSEPTPEGIDEAVARDLTLSCYRAKAIARAARAAASLGVTAEVQLKVDTGMHRVGCAPAEAPALAAAIAAAPSLRFGALWTHFAVADEPDHPFTARQLARLEEVAAVLGAHGLRPPLLHAANSAGALLHPRSRLDLVRCGIATYGYHPTPHHRPVALSPALSWKAKVQLVRELEAGEAVSYGLRYRLERRSRIAVVPLGYHDGVPRRLAAAGGEVLIGGRRRPIAGTVTMDQLMIDCGPAGEGKVAVGDEAVLIGRQGAEAISADEWAQRLGTISYEVLCAIGPRVPRRVVDTGWPGARARG
ncbi:MAG: alanine racemase [Actinomycetota bacterium]|nr:alanine racemase [Actinomycetota bacterium]